MKKILPFLLCISSLFALNINISNTTILNNINQQINTQPKLKKISLNANNLDKFSNNITQDYDKTTLIVRFKVPDVFKINLFLKANGIKSYKLLSHITQTPIGILKIDINQNLSQVIENLKNNPLVKSVELNYIRKPQYIPNDTLFNNQWYLNPDSNSKDINISGVWDEYKGDKNIVVAVFDTGISLEHEDLKDNIWVNEEELNGKPGVDDDGDGYVDDIYGYDFAHDMDGNNSPIYGDIGSHGTHVSGIIGGVGDNDLGISGVNMDVTILPVKIFRPNEGAYNSDILEAIDYILKLKENGLNIVAVNASYGGFGGDAQSGAMYDALKKLEDNNIVFFAAAGNSGYDNDRLYYDMPALPASYNLNNVVAVAANDEKGKITYFSQYGKKTVQVSAPGYNILSTVDFIDGNDTNSEIGLDNFDGDNNITFYKSEGSEWNVTSNDYHSPTHSLTDSPNGNYNDDNSTYIVSDDINLSSYKQKPIALDFCMNNKLAQGDMLIVYFYDSKENVYSKQKYYTSTNGWKCSGIPIPEYYKTDKFKVAFLLYPNQDGNSNDGVYLDDIKIGTYKNTNAYENWAGTSMATPVVTGSYALLTQIFPNENMYEKISRLIGNGEKLIDNIMGVNLNIGEAKDKEIKTFILNTKVTRSVEDEVSLDVIDAGDNPKVFIGDKEAKIISRNGNEINVSIPDEAQNYLYIKNGNLISSNKLYISKWKMVTKIPSLNGYNAHMFGVYALYDNKIYTLEGLKGSVDIYNIDTNSWESASASDDTPIRYATSQVYNGKIYMFGGEDDNGYIDNVRIYDILNDSFSDGVTLPTHFKLAKSVIIDDNIYILEGVDEDGTSNKFYKYSISENQFTQLANCPEKTTFSSMCTFNNRIYLFGGKLDDNNLSKEAYVYDTQSNKWTKLSNLPIELYASGCVNVNNEFIAIFSGIKDNNNNYNHTFIRYYPDSDKYEEINESILSNVFDRGVVGDNILSNGVDLYYMGGYNEYVGETATVETIKLNELKKPPELIDDSNESNNSNDNNDSNISNNNNINNSNSNNNNSRKHSGSAPAFDFMTLIMILGGSLFIFKRKQ